MKNKLKNKPSQARCYTFLMLVAIFIMQISAVSAFEFDNIENFDSKIGEYGKYEIRNSVLGLEWWQLGKVADLELKNNTDRCGEWCGAIKTIRLYEEGSLVDDARFFKEVDGNWQPTDIREYSLYTQQGTNDEVIENYEEQCTVKSTLGNGTKLYDCEIVKVGETINKVPNWVPFNEGDTFPIGTYQVRLLGSKKATWKVDWQIKSNNIWTTEWAIWGIGDNVTQTHNSTETVASGTTEFGGMKFRADKANTQITSAIKSSLASCTVAQIWYDNKSVYVGDTSFSGDVVTFPPTDLIIGDFYYIVCSGGGPAYSARQNNTLSFTYPLSDSLVTWNNSLSSDGITDDLNSAWNIESINVTDAAGFVTLNSPANDLGFTGEVTFNCSAEQVGSDLVNITLITNETSWSNKNTSLVTGSTNSTTFVRTFPSGVFNWSCKACDGDGDCGFAGENRTIIVDATPPVIEVETPKGILSFGAVGSNETLNVTFTDSNLDSCWYDYNGTNITIGGCLSTIKNSTNFTLEINNANMTLYVNDTSGNENSSFISWSYKVLEIDQTFNNQTIEGSSEDFLATIQLGSGLSISAATLIYNGTIQVGVSEADGDNISISKNNFIIPEIGNQENVSFHWSLVLSDSDIINLTTFNQTILNVTIDNCSTFTNTILNLTMVDEELQTPLENTTIEIALDLLSTDRSQIVVSVSGSFVDENPLGICLSQNITGSTSYSVDSIIRYIADGYANEYFNLVNLTLNNQSTTTNLTLFDLNLSDSTEFQLTFNGLDFLPVENALIFVERQYIAENTFKTVELPKTDSNGQTVLHLVRNDVIYNMVVVKEGVVLGTFSNIIAFCEDFTIGSCTINLNALGNDSVIFNYNEGVGILYEASPEYNSTTNDVSFSFVSTDGSPKVVIMDVERRDVFGNQSICSTVLVSTSGTVSCNVGSDLTDTSLIATVAIDNKTWIVSTVPIDTSAFGEMGYAFWFILTLSLILMLGDRKNGVMFAIVLSYIGAIGLGIGVGGIIGVGSAGIWIIIITVVGIWQINKGRPS